MALSKIGFKKFLERNLKTGIRFMPGRSRLCPLAKYLELEGGKSIDVTKTEIYVNGKKRSMPMWAHEFVSRFDRINNKRVCAATALHTLNTLGVE